MPTLADLARLDAILKDRAIQDSIQKAINTGTEFLSRITNQQQLSGRKGIFPAQFGVNEGVFARPDKGTFGDSQVPAPQLAEVTARYVYALFDISGPTISATRDNEGAFQSALSLMLENTIQGLQLDLNRMAIGTGSGTIGLVVSRVDADTVTVNSPYGLSRYKSSRPVRGLFREDMALDIKDDGSSTFYLQNGQVAGVTHSSTVTTLDFVSGTSVGSSAAAGDFVLRHGNLGVEIEGFLAAVDTTGSYMNISRAGRPGWQGVLVDAAGGGSSPVALTPDHLRDTVDTIAEVSGLAPTFMVGNYKARRNVYNLYAPSIRRAPMVLPAGLREDTLEFDDMRFVVERFFPPEHIGFVNQSTWVWAIDRDVEWIPGEGGTVLRFLVNSDVYRAVLRTYRNLYCRFPAANGLIYGLAE